MVSFYCESFHKSTRFQQNQRTINKSNHPSGTDDEYREQCEILSRSREDKLNHLAALHDESARPRARGGAGGGGSKAAAAAASKAQGGGSLHDQRRAICDEYDVRPPAAPAAPCLPAPRREAIGVRRRPMRPLDAADAPPGPGGGLDL